MDSALHILSGCQCFVIRNMVAECHNIARIILKVVSKGSNLVHVDVGSADRLAQRDLHITEKVSNRTIPQRSPYRFDPSILDEDRCSSSRPYAVLVTPSPANPNRPPTLPSRSTCPSWVLRSTRHNDEVRSSSTPARQLHGLNIQKHHIHLIEIKYCEDTMPGARLEASQQKH
eukprot:660849-Pelagomonas_calceolata.AAC.1